MIKTMMKILQYYWNPKLNIQHVEDMSFELWTTMSLNVGTTGQ